LLVRQPLKEHLVFFRAERWCWKSAIKPINGLALWLDPKNRSRSAGAIATKPSVMISRESSLDIRSSEFARAE
jgi:hypothetical protein